jgi:hypothetical protein
VLRRLKIENFRALRHFGMSGLGRVNLLVGTNNCGKTSVLEAIHILTEEGPEPLWASLGRRGEYADGVRALEGDVAHLVHGRVLQPGVAFSIEGANATNRRNLVAALVASRDEIHSDLIDEDLDSESQTLFELRWQRDGADSNVVSFPLSRRKTIPFRVRGRAGESEPTPVNFITTDGLSRDEVVDLFSETALTSDEDTVLEALRTIEPTIERIASIVGRHGRSSTETRGGLAAMVGGQRIPIGSMGDGIWHLLGISLALVRARGGILLVDEIDTGLHYTGLEKMWRLVFETAKRLDTQVFATTHSRDCYEALAAVTQADRDEISLQRIEHGKPEAVAFSEAEIQQAAKGPRVNKSMATAALDAVG